MEYIDIPMTAIQIPNRSKVDTYQMRKNQQDPSYLVFFLIFFLDGKSWIASNSHARIKKNHTFPE